MFWTHERPIRTCDASFPAPVVGYSGTARRARHDDVDGMAVYIFDIVDRTHHTRVDHGIKLHPSCLNSVAGGSSTADAPRLISEARVIGNIDRAGARVATPQTCTRQQIRPRNQCRVIFDCSLAFMQLRRGDPSAECERKAPEAAPQHSWRAVPELRPSLEQPNSDSLAAAGGAPHACRNVGHYRDDLGLKVNGYPERRRGDLEEHAGCSTVGGQQVGDRAHTWCKVTHGGPTPG